MFEEIPDETFDEREQRILKFWKENRIFLRSLENRRNSPHFSFYDGPPFAQACLTMAISLPGRSKTWSRATRR